MRVIELFKIRSFQISFKKEEFKMFIFSNLHVFFY